MAYGMSMGNKWGWNNKLPGKELSMKEKDDKRRRKEAIGRHINGDTNVVEKKSAYGMPVNEYVEKQKANY